jgi:hypothetical protein
MEHHSDARGLAGSRLYPNDRVLTNPLTFARFGSVSNCRIVESFVLSGIQPKTGEAKPWQKEALRLQGEIDKLKQIDQTSILLQGGGRAVFEKGIALMLDYCRSCLAMRTGMIVAAWMFAASMAAAQTRAVDFQLTKITKNLISAPQFSYTGAQQYATNQRDRWLEVEVEFTAAPDFTDELTFKYFILLNGKLLTGEVTHVNVAAGRENRSVMYVSPRALARFAGKAALTPNAVQNVAVQILQKGAVKDELSVARAPGQWYAGLPAVSGFVLNKNETPFAPLYWDRYEQIKAR